MIRRHPSASPHPATSSRRERPVRRDPAPQWVRAKRRLQRILHRSEVAIRQTHCQVVDSVLHIFAHPKRSTQRFVAAGDRLARIAEWLERAGACYRQILELSVLEPETAGDAPDVLASEALHILDVGKYLAEVSDELDAWLETLGDPDELRKLIAPPRPAPAWLLSQYPSLPSDLLLILLLCRRRSRCRATEDAPRRISRGRAPPFVQTCSL
jgi:hypothetical protein